MATRLRDTPEWKLGDTAQKQFARLLALQRGSLVVPTYGMDDVDSSTKAPVLYYQNNKLVAPDLLEINEEARWWDVKAKSRPTWRRTHSRWEHGCDYSIAEEYRKVQQVSGLKVLIVVHETESPENRDSESSFIESGVWFGISISKAFRVGCHRADWPGGKSQPHRRGRFGKGGLLWPRNEMKELKVV